METVIAALIEYLPYKRAQRVASRYSPMGSFVSYLNEHASSLPAAGSAPLFRWLLLHQVAATPAEHVPDALSSLILFEAGGVKDSTTSGSSSNDSPTNSVGSGADPSPTTATSTNVASEASSPPERETTNASSSTQDAVSATRDANDVDALETQLIQLLDGTTQVYCRGCDSTCVYPADQLICKVCLLPIGDLSAPSLLNASAAVPTTFVDLATLTQLLADERASSVARMQTAVSNVESKHQTSIKDLESKHQTSFKDIESKHQTSIKDMESKHQTSIKDLKTEFKKFKTANSSADMSVFLIQLTDIMQRIIRLEFSKLKEPLNIPPNQSVLSLHQTNIDSLPLTAQSLFSILKSVSDPRNAVAHPNQLEIIRASANFRTISQSIDILFYHLCGALLSPDFEEVFRYFSVGESAQSLSIRGLGIIISYSTVAGFDSIVKYDLSPENLLLFQQMHGN
jgi:hypothetical protein